MTMTSLKHIIFVAGPSKSHVQPGVKFCVNFVNKNPNLYISVYTLALLADFGAAFLSTQTKEAQNRIRIIPSVLDMEIASPLDVVLALEKSFGPWILEQLSVPSFEAGGHVIAPPSHIIEDHINGGISLASKDEHKLPIISWWLTAAASMIAHFGNEEHGQGDRLFITIGELMAKQQPGSEKSIEEVFHHVLSDRVLCVPGLPPFYEHEQIPQLLPMLLPFVVAVQPGWNKMRDQVDIVAISSTYEFEPVAAEACANAFTHPIKPYFVGPGVEFPSTAPTELDSTIKFLDQAQSDLGPKSVIYMAFGTLFFPLPESARHLEIIIEEIISQGFRLIFALSSAIAGMNERLKEKLTASGDAIFPTWVNQLRVLEHPAIHYFVSHGGWNSTTEAVVRGVPMIFWPFAADQPTNVLQFTTQHDCGFQLLQVRSGAARSKAYPDITITGTDDAVRSEVRGYLEASKGGRGRQQRLNVKALGKIMKGSFEKGGSADLALEELGKALGL
ncbi:glycosyltransferase family 1 protein [Ceratobasidium sp. AG-Ba]|nr:glycosyltransferase family 1 protein [Ceratobasidium sp. AG-Ba]